MFGSGLFKGLGITARHTVGKPVTEIYPFRAKTLPAGSRTFLAMHVTDEGAPSCKACNTCVVGCPDRVLVLEKDPEDNRRALEFVVNSGRCTFCGICVENCPYDSLYFTADFERATRDKGALVYHLIHEGRSTHEGEAPDRTEPRDGGVGPR